MFHKFPGYSSAWAVSSTSSTRTMSLATVTGGSLQLALGIHQGHLCRDPSRSSQGSHREEPLGERLAEKTLCVRWAHSLTVYSTPSLFVPFRRQPCHEPRFPPTMIAQGPWPPSRASHFPFLTPHNRLWGHLALALPFLNLAQQPSAPLPKQRSLLKPPLKSWKR